MKNLILIAITVLSFSTMAQTPMFKIGKITVTDYDAHVQGSMLIQTGATSVFYMLTEKNVLSNFLGSIFAVGVGMFKEEVIDRNFKMGTPSNLDKEADIRGAAYAGYINTINIHIFEKKRLRIDTLQYQNLAPLNEKQD